SDIIVEFDGEAVRSARQFTRLVRESAPARPGKGTIVRDGSRRDGEITPADGRDGLVIAGDRLRDRLGDLYERMPQFNFDFDLPFAFDGRGRLGVSVQELTPQLASYFGVKDGVLGTWVTDDVPASRAGLKAGDVITKIDNTTVGSREDLVRALREVKDGGETTIGIVRAKKEL